ncbi:MAG: hypothetical protein WBW85_15505, partial [Terriglobales bacterium]
AGSQATITATSAADTSISGPLILSVVDITTDVSPALVNVGTGLTQQFTAVAVPDDAPQSFTWTCTANGVACANFVQDPNVSGLAYYKALDNCTGSCVSISAITPLDASGCTTNPKYCTVAKASLVTSRISGAYAFRFSGYDSSNHPVAVAGMFTAVNGAISSGVEDELTSAGPATAISISGGSYTPTTADVNNSNNAGVLTLTLPNEVYPNKFQVTLDGAGDVAMIESDGHGTGSGIAEKASTFNSTTDQTFAFGFTGVDSSGNHVGYAGLMPFNGSGGIVSGLMDVNDNGTSSNSICSAPPCAVGGSYQNVNGVWHLALISPITMNFDFFVANGTSSANNPLTLYAISTDSINPAVSGTMVLQDSTKTYNNAAFKGTSVSALTGTGANGANTNVSLTLGTTDGNGNFSGQFDQNNAGTILSGVQFPPAGSTYTYAAANAANGRYTFQMLGNPGANPVVAPLPFVLYASGANRGFLLDQSSASVMTGTMNPQGKGSGIFSGSELPGTFAAATTSSGGSGVTPLAANFLLTSPGNQVFNTGGTLYPGAQAIPSGSTYTLTDSGPGTIVLNFQTPQNYAIYTVDTSGCTGSSPVCAITDFYMIDEDKTNTAPSVIFAQQ